MLVFLIFLSLGASVGDVQHACWDHKWNWTNKSGNSQEKCVFSSEVDSQWFNRVLLQQSGEAG